MLNPAMAGHGGLKFYGSVTRPKRSVITLILEGIDKSGKFGPASVSLREWKINILPNAAVNFGDGATVRFPSQVCEQVAFGFADFHSFSLWELPRQ
jgi:hypothetical protein